MTLSSWLKRSRPGVAALVVVLVGLSAGWADEPKLGPKKAEDAKKLSQLAQDLEKNKTNVANWLRTTLGFSPELNGFPLDAHTYFDLPDVVKLQAAYDARESAQADTGAILLELMNKRLELDILQKKEDSKKEEQKKLAEDIIALFKKLNPNFKLDDSQTMLVKFVFKPLPKRPILPENDQQRLAVLAQYLEQARNGGPSEALIHYFGVTADAAHLLLWESGTVQRAFEGALLQHEEKERTAFLETVVKRANEDALKRKDRALERTAILWSKAPQKEPGDDDLPPVTPPRAAKIPDAPAPVLTPEKRADIYKKDIAKAVSLKPAEVRKRADNPTGIFFASELRADPALPKPASVEYTPGSDATNGKLTIAFADGSKRTLAPVQAEDAWVAYEMTYGSAAAKAGDGIELLVLDGPHSYFEVKDNKLLTAHRREVIVNPALLDTNLGLACVRIDGMPRTRQWLLDEIAADPAWSHLTKEQAARRRQVLEQEADWLFDPWTNLARKYGAHSSVFRVTDVPLFLSGGDGVLLVERDDPEHHWSDPLRRRTFIEAEVVIQRYTQLGRPAGAVKRPEYYQPEAYKLMAELVPVSVELQRINNFAAVLGVVRWAKGADAKFTAPAKPKDGPRVPEAVAIFPERIIPLQGHSKDEVLKQETAKLDAELKKLAENAKVKEFEEVCAKVLNTDDDEARAKLAEKADELARSSAEVRLLEDLVEAKYTEILLIGRKMMANDDKKPDLEAEKKRLIPLLRKLDKLKEESPAEFLIGASLLDRYLKRLEEQGKVD
jgi:hypothetical protein